MGSSLSAGGTRDVPATEYPPDDRNKASSSSSECPKLGQGATWAPLGTVSQEGTDESHHSDTPETNGVSNEVSLGVVVHDTTDESGACIATPNCGRDADGYGESGEAQLQQVSFLAHSFGNSLNSNAGPVGRRRQSSAVLAGDVVESDHRVQRTVSVGFSKRSSHANPLPAHPPLFEPSALGISSKSNDKEEARCEVAPLTSTMLSIMSSTLPAQEVAPKREERAVVLTVSHNSPDIRGGPTTPTHDDDEDRPFTLHRQSTVFSPLNGDANRNQGNTRSALGSAALTPIGVPMYHHVQGHGDLQNSASHTATDQSSEAVGLELSELSRIRGVNESLGSGESPTQPSLGSLNSFPFSATSPNSKGPFSQTFVSVPSALGQLEHFPLSNVSSPSVSRHRQRLQRALRDGPGSFADDEQNHDADAIGEIPSMSIEPVTPRSPAITPCQQWCPTPTNLVLTPNSQSLSIPSTRSQSFVNDASQNENTGGSWRLSDLSRTSPLAAQRIRRRHQVQSFRQHSNGSASLDETEQMAPSSAIVEIVLASTTTIPATMGASMVANVPLFLANSTHGMGSFEDPPTPLNQSMHSSRPSASLSTSRCPLDESLNPLGGSCVKGGGDESADASPLAQWDEKSSSSDSESDDELDDVQSNSLLGRLRIDGALRSQRASRILSRVSQSQRAAGSSLRGDNDAGSCESPSDDKNASETQIVVVGTQKKCIY